MTIIMNKWTLLRTCKHVSNFCNMDDFSNTTNIQVQDNHFVLVWDIYKSNSLVGLQVF